MDHLGMKEGFDVGLEISGHSDALNGMLAAMCHGGQVAVLGIQSKNATVERCIRSCQCQLSVAGGGAA
jgi:threonine 3-dehydrogenase